MIVTAVVVGPVEETIEPWGREMVPELQPLSIDSPSAHPKTIPIHRIFLPRKNTQKAAATPAGKKGKPGRTGPPVAWVETISVAVTGPPFGVTEAGEKEHDAPLGNPLHAKKTVWLKPFAGVSVIVLVVCCPAGTESEAGLSERENAGLGRVIT